MARTRPPISSLERLAGSSWRLVSAVARRTHGAAWRSVLIPRGSRRQRLLRAAARSLMEAASQPSAESMRYVMRRVAASKGAVIFLPSIGWNAKLFQRPHHLARAFARAGYVAVFDSTNVDDDLCGFEEREPNLFLFRGRSSVLHRLSRPVLWTFPYNYHEAAAYPRPATVVYDWIDALDVFADHDRRLVHRNHERALSEADLLASVSRALHGHAVARRSDALYLPNAVDGDHFRAEGAPFPDDPAIRRLREEGKPIAGYYGALARWFDYELLEKVARLRRDWNFLLIGPDYDGSVAGTALLECPNVTWIGPRPYSTLPGYLRVFDVATIPFRVEPITMATSPLKLYEYFAGGRAVVTSPLPECVAHPEVHAAETADEFAAALDVARRTGADPTSNARLRSVAAANSWRERVRQVEEALALRATPAEAAS